MKEINKKNCLMIFIVTVFLYLICFPKINVNAQSTFDEEINNINKQEIKAQAEDVKPKKRGRPKKENLSKLEDVVYCNDRSVQNGNYGGWSKDEDASNFIYYSSYIRMMNGTPNLNCNTLNNNRDRFTYKDTLNGNGLLKWPVGLLTADEIILAGGQRLNNSDYYLNTGQTYWALSPSYFNIYLSYGFRVSSSGFLGDYIVSETYEVRPVVTLASNVEITGLGTVDSPYIAK